MNVFVVTGIRKFDSNIDPVPVIFLDHKFKCHYCQKQFTLSGLYAHINACSTGTHDEVKAKNAWKRRVTRYATKHDLNYDTAEQAVRRNQENKNSATILLITDPSVAEAQEKKATSIEGTRKSPRGKTPRLGNGNSQNKAEGRTPRHGNSKSQNKIEPNMTVEYFQEKLKNIDNIWLQGSVDYSSPTPIIPNFWVYSPFNLKPSQVKKMTPGKFFYVIFVIIRHWFELSTYYFIVVIT